MRSIYIVTVAITLAGMTSSVAARSAPDGLHATTGGTADWPEYEHDITGSGYTTDTGISVLNASTLASRAGWPSRSASGAMITAQPIESGGYLYWGSWDGVEHGTPVNGGAGGWATSMGTLTYPPTSACAKSGVHGVGDAGVVANVTTKGNTGPVLFVAGGGNDFVGGGWSSMYALDALTGSVLWKTQIAPSPDVYLWSSPLYFQSPGQTDPSIYEGVADVGEPCPLVRGAVVQLDALTGAIQNTFYTVPSGCTGATVWGSLTIDAAAHAVYAVTGNRGACKVNEPYSYAIVKLDASTLSVLDTWHLPKSEQVTTDDDFGSVPILFQGTVSGQSEPLVGAPNKNGIFYIWNRNDLAAGPVYRLAVANHNVGDIAPAAFDGTVLYIGTPATTVNGVRESGSVQAYNVSNLPNQLWETNLTAPVLASATAAPGIVVVNAGHKTVIIDASTGAVLKTLQAALVSGTRGSFWGAAIIAGGVLYEGDTQGFVYAYSPGGQ